MNIFLLIEERDQKNYSSKAGFPAEPMSSIIGVYADREKAEREREMYSECSSQDVKDLDCDLCTYIIEERPLL